MSRVSAQALIVFAAAAASILPAYGQAVVSTRSGLVHYFEGAVFVAGQPLESRLGKFTSIPEGAELRTEQGRAEILLTPGVILRVGEKSSVRMTANALADTRVEVVSGSALLESAEPVVDTSVTLTYKQWSVHETHQGLYRIDCDPPRLQVRQGEVTVTTGGGAPVSVAQGMEMPLAPTSAPTTLTADAHDPLSDWSEGRSESISADNAIAANIEDPASLTGVAADGFTYFPLLGYPSLSSSLGSPYGSGGSYQPGLYSPLVQSGFYSVYLPGLTYRPYLLRLPLTGLRPLYPPSYPPSRVIGLPRPPLQLPTPAPRSPSVVTRPAPVVTRPATPPPAAHPVPHPVIHH